MMINIKKELENLNMFKSQNKDLFTDSQITKFIKDNDLAMNYYDGRAEILPQKVTDILRTEGKKYYYNHNVVVITHKRQSYKRDCRNFLVFYTEDAGKRYRLLGYECTGLSIAYHKNIKELITLAVFLFFMIAAIYFDATFGQVMGATFAALLIYAMISGEISGGYR